MLQKKNFSLVARKQLADIVSLTQQHSFAQGINALQKRSHNLQWLLQGVETNLTQGISSDPTHLQQRAQHFGLNKRPDKPLSTFFELFIQALDDFILKILIAASLVSIAVQVGTADDSHRSTAWIEGFVVLLAVAIVALVTAVNNYSKERQFRKLKGVAQERKRVTAYRDGKVVDLHQDEVLVGDIIAVTEGMEIPADALLLQSNQVTTDESAMTGESEPINKNIFSICQERQRQVQCISGKVNNKHGLPSPFLISGTRVLTGQGRMVVIVVGDLSCKGSIKLLVNQDQQDQMTPLQKKLERLAGDIGKFGLYSALAILIILLLRFGIEKGISKDWDTSRDIKEIISYFILALTVIVVAIPEGLPLSVTLSLAVSVKKMLNDNNLVRRMDACETMGGANNICSDKTGTLTLNKMTLTQIWTGQTHLIDNYLQKLDLQQLTNNSEWQDLLKINICVNSTAHLFPEEKGSSTEIALLQYLLKAGVDYTSFRQKYVAPMKMPFSSARKRMSVVLPYGREQMLFVKGASQLIVSSCSRWHNPNNNTIEALNNIHLANINKTINKMAESSLRTLCLAYKPIPQNADLKSKDEKGVFNIQSHDLILLCILGVRDIPRMQVPSAIAKCHKAGIKVRMVTGDNLITARAIALDVGIITIDDDSIVMEGTQFIEAVGGVVCKTCRTKQCQCARTTTEAQERKVPLRVDTILNGKEFDRIKDRLMVLARSRPQDKYALVTGLRERGSVVAVTGDGTNDAPALKKADIGFAMGITGTQVAREAASIILLDDNFNSLVKAVMWGRNIYDCIRKFIQFQITVNVVAVFITLIGASLIKQQILAPIQMLWVNLIMDTLASLALATQPPNEQLLDRPPNSRHEHIISRNILKHILGQALFQLLVLVTLIFWGELIIPEYTDSYDSGIFLTKPKYKWYNGVVGGTVRSGRTITISGSDDYQSIYNETDIESRHFTFIFNTFVMMQIFNFVNSRKIHDELNIFAGITLNPLFVIIVGVIIILQVILVTFAGSAFHVYNNYGLTYQQWFICCGIAAFSWLVNLLLKIHKMEQPLPVAQEQQEGSRVDPTKEDMQTESHIIKVREAPLKNDSKIQMRAISVSEKRSSKDIVNIGFH